MWERIVTVGGAVVLAAVALPLYKVVYAFLRYQMNKGKYSHLPRMKQTMPLIDLADIDNGFEHILDEFVDENGKTSPLIDCGPYPDGGHVVSVQSPEGLKQLFDEERFPKLRVSYDTFKVLLGDGLVTSTGAKWKKQRRLLTPLFHFSNLKTMSDTIANQSTRMINELKAQGSTPVELVPLFSQVALRIIIATAFGESQYLNPEQMGPMWRRLNEIFNTYFIADILLGTTVHRTLPWPWLTNINRLMAEMKSLVQSAIDERRAKGIDTDVSKQTDLMSAMLVVRDEDGNGIDDEQIIAESLTFLFAGRDTTSNLMAWTTYLLSTRPEIQEKLFEEVESVLKGNPPTHSQTRDLKYCRQVLNESLRLRPPAPFVERQAAQDCEIEGQHIPKGTYMWAMITAVHLDRSIWKNPHEFDPSRWESEGKSNRHSHSFVPFIAGSRNCIGQKFAITEATILLASIIQAFKILPDPQQRKVIMALEGTAAPKHAHVVFEPRT